MLLDHDENALHALGYELDREHAGMRYDLVVGSIRDRAKLDALIGEHRPEVVFHTAAHKHVPLLERAADEAILNNVGGTLHVAQAAAAGGVRWFVHTSSDKAVDPVSMLGTTKLLAEQVVRAVAARAPEGGTYVSVRFGNVLGSQGSVVRVFQDQIRRGGPVTVTHPDMTRYVMTIPEAARLVDPGRGARRERRGLLPGDGHPGADQQAGRGHDPARRRGPRGHPDRVHGPAARASASPRSSTRPTSAPRPRPTRASPGSTPGQEPRADFLDLIAVLLRAAEVREWGDVAACLDKLQPGFELPAETTDRV